jgi:hypothetical protein
MRNKSKNSALLQLVESGCDEKLLRSAAQYLAKPKEHATRLSLPKREDVDVLFDAANRLEGFCREIFLFEVFASLPGFASVADTIKALRFQAALANNFILILQKKLNPNLRGFCVKALSNHVREKTGKPNWNLLAQLIEEFGGKIDDIALKQLYYHFTNSPASKVFE